MNAKPIISVVIPCFNAKKHIGACLDSILKSKFPNYEIIVIDDGSTDGGRKILKKYEKDLRVKVYSFTKNQGPAKARNLGVKKSQGEYIIFLDIDTQIKSGCLKEVVNAFKKNKNIGGAQLKLLKGKTNKLDSAGHFLSLIGFPYEIGVGENEKKYDRKKLIFGAKSAGMVVRKDVFEKINGFDEDYFIYGEDTDLSWRIWLAGYKILYLPKARVYHFQKSSLNKKTKHRIFYEGAKNNTGNNLKNANVKMLVWMLPLHFLGWLLLSLKLILQKRFKMALSIYQGLIWNLANPNKILKKRQQINRYRKTNNQLSQIILGNLDFKTILIKGWQWSKNV